MLTGMLQTLPVHLLPVTSLQLKEEMLDGEEYSFLQGASDQESNGSASFYIKQEP